MYSHIIQRARALGFVAVGFTRPQRPLFFEAFKNWLSSGYHGDMAWLERNLELRENPGRLLKEAKTLISLAYPYPSQKPVTLDGYSVSRYAQPCEPDYHDRLKDLLRRLDRYVKDLLGPCRSRVFVDSAPIMERSAAVAAGLGFIGKNNTLIIPGHGSYVFLAEILTTATIDFPKVEPMAERCGDCRLCLENCPTGALMAPHLLDATKCLAYLTIEYKGTVPRETGKWMGRCFYGCDRCQEACPFNNAGTEAGVALPPVQELLDMDEGVFRKRYGLTALSRGGLSKLQDNIRAVLSR